MRLAAPGIPSCSLPASGAAIVSLLAAALLPAPSQAAVTATDDGGHVLTLTYPAKRIVSLAPHATELVFAAGAGSKLVGVSEFSDYPPLARSLPSIGSSMQLDVERIVALKPDLIIAWQSGNNARQVARLRKLGYAVYESEPQRLADIPRTLENLGALTGTGQGIVAARDFRERQQALRQRYAGKVPVRVFYQIWPSPLMTLNDRHIVSDALALCGGVNVFGKLPQLAPTISREAVVAAKPDAIIASDERNESWDRWRALPQLTAVRLGNLYRIDGAVMNRAGPRMLDATDALCRQIDEARKRLAGSVPDATTETKAHKKETR
jgi:iron complex transport system substrate-binding protein